MAGLIPDTFLDALLARTDVVEVIGARLTLKKAGSNYQALCPFHTEKSPSFTVSPDKQFYHCFGCGAHGTAIRFIMEYDRLPFPEAVEVLARQAGMEIPREAQQHTDPGTTALYELLGKASQFFAQCLRQHPQRQRAVDYLKNRGLSGEIAARFGIGFAPAGWDNLLRKLKDEKHLLQAGMAIQKDGGGVYDRFRDRIMFPIRDRRGRTIGFGGRVLDGGEPKYLNSPETPVFHKGRELYGLHECLQADRKPREILVVEGYMDVVALAQHGLNNAVATLGTATTTQQVDRLFQTVRDVVFCFDGDRAGKQAAWRALENVLPAMRDDRQARFLFLPDGEDPDSLIRTRGAEGFNTLLAEASPLSDFLFRELSSEADMRSIDGRARATERAAPLLNKVPPGVYRDLLIEELARQCGVKNSHIEAAMAGRAPPEQARQAPRHSPAGAAQAPRGKTHRTTVRLVVALLLQRPALATLAGEPGRLMPLQEQPGMSLLIQLLEICQRDPNIHTSALLERFSGTEHESAVWKLAAWDHHVPASGTEEEFLDSIKKLETLLAQERLQYLQQRLEAGDMTAEERHEWLKLLRARNS